jgi:hypoxanthine-DNA glycosylase
MSIIRGFAPIADADSRVLILGSVPSIASLAKGEYYGHPRNAFWSLISALLGEPYQDDYVDRKLMLLRHGIALWDVVAACERSGSKDAAIRNAVINDFTEFFAAHSALRHVFFNGTKASELYKQHVGFSQGCIRYDRLGSTSPAHAVSFDKRLSDWQRILTHLQGEA